MGAHDKVSNKIDDVAGKAKEAVGKATDDHSTEAEGKLDQAKSSLKDAAEHVKDAFKKLTATIQRRGRPPVDPIPVVFRVFTRRSNAGPMRRPPRVH